MQCHVMAAMGVPFFPSFFVDLKTSFYTGWLLAVITAFGNLLLKFICINA